MERGGNSISSPSVIRATFCLGRRKGEKSRRAPRHFWCGHRRVPMNLSCVNRFPPFFSLLPPPPPPPWMSRWRCRITFPRSFLLLLLLYRIPPMLLGELSVSRICQSEPYSDRLFLRASIAAFFQDPFHPSSYSLSSLILAIRELGILGWSLFGKERVSRRGVLKNRGLRKVKSFWLGNVQRWCTEFSSGGVFLKWLGNGLFHLRRPRSRFSARHDKLTTWEIKLTWIEKAEYHFWKVNWKRFVNSFRAIFLVS